MNNKFISNPKMNPTIRQTIYNPAYHRALNELLPITEHLDPEENREYIAEFTEKLWKSQLFFEYLYFTLMQKPNIYMQNKYELFFEQSSDKLLKLYITIGKKIKNSKKLDDFKKEINNIYTKSNDEYYYTLSHFIEIFDRHDALLHHVVGNSLLEITDLLNYIIQNGYLNLTKHGKNLKPKYTDEAFKNIHDLYNKSKNPLFAPPSPTYPPPKKPVTGKRKRKKTKKLKKSTKKR